MQRNGHGVFDESGDVGSLSGCDQGANFLQLLVLQGDGHLSCCHTIYHTILPTVVKDLEDRFVGRGAVEAGNGNVQQTQVDSQLRPVVDHVV